MQISRGKIQCAQKVIIYGPEGIGKSTFASQFPESLFIDTEGSTKHLDVARLPKPYSWTMLLEEIKYVKNNPNICKTLIIDTADWAEQLCTTELCAKSKKNGIEDFGYGKGYVYLAEEFGRLLNALEELIELGINIVFTAHTQMRKFEEPHEMGAYDRWEMKLQKKTAPLVKEWADMVLFANYKTYVIKKDDNKSKAQGGNRVMYTTHHPCWDAKNRHNLPEEIPFEYLQIAHCVTTGIPTTEAKAKTNNNLIGAVITEAQLKTEPETRLDNKIEADAVKQDVNKLEDLSQLPKQLADLMTANNVTVKEIRRAVASKGYYPEDTSIANYDQSFVNGVLVAAWGQVFKIIQKLREVPF